MLISYDFKTQYLYTIGAYSCSMVPTTIQLSQELKDRLEFRKLSKKDSYEEVIWDLLEDTMELNEQTKKEIKIARQEFEQGKFVTHTQLKKELGL